MGKDPKKLKKLSTNQCAAPGCTNTTNASNVTFHNFPGTKAIREKWKAFCGSDFSDYLCKKYMLCSAHFNTDCFDSDIKSRSSNSIATLKELAIPTIGTPTQLNDVKLNFVDKNQPLLEPDPQNISRCRICLARRSDLENIFSGEILNHASKIEQCVQIDVKEDDNLPQNICIECIQLLENAFKFKNLCEHSNQILKQELLNRIQLIKREISSNENELNSTNNQTRSIKEEFEQHEEIETNSDIFHDENIDQSDYDNDETERDSNTFNDNNDKSIQHIEETSHMKFNDKNENASKKDINTKTDLDSVESDDSGDSDWMDPKTNPKNEKAPKENKIKNPKETKTKNPKETKVKDLKVKKKRLKPGKVRKIQCDECGYVTVGPSNLEDHKRAVHRGITDFYKCQLCPKAFKKQSLLQAHINVVHDINPVVCDTCGKTFKNKYLLNNHRVTTHLAVKKFKCDYCSYVATCRASVRKHKTIHTDERKYECQICKKTFRASSTLLSHIKAVHQNIRPFKCEMCEKSFSNKNKLRRHSVIHTGYKPFPCPICPNVTYSYYVALESHRRTLHPGTKLETETTMYKNYIQENNLCV